METKKLAALAVAAEQGSFTKAAERLGYTQSGLTHMMNGLERELGFPLLVRGRTGVRLTEAGERIFPLVQELLHSAESLEQEIALINTGKEETVRIASYASIAMHWLPEVLRQFRLRCPGVTVEVQMGSVQEVYRWVREDKVDLCFASRQEGLDLAWTHLASDPLLAILPPDEQPRSKQGFDVRDFDGREFLMPSMGFSLDIMRVFERYRITPVVRTTQVSDSVVISMVEHGLGVSILSELVLKGRKDDVLALPLLPASVRELGIASRPHRELRPAVRRLIACAEEVIAAL